MPEIRPGVQRLFRLPSRRREAAATEVDEEIRLHLQLRAEQLVQRGLPPDQARAEAERRFDPAGSLDDARRRLHGSARWREARLARVERFDALSRDVRYAWRGLRRSPGFAAVVILTLALGLGASTAMFTLANAVFLRPLPVSHPEQLVGFGDPTLVGITHAGSPRTDIFSYPLYTALRDRTRLVPALFASGLSSRFDLVVPDAAPPGGGTRAGGAEPEPVLGRLVSGNYFAVLGVRAVAGRTLTAGDDRASGAGPVAVISHAYWRRRFALDPAVVGRTVLVNRTPLTIVGVTPPGFAGEVVGRPTDLWAPLTMQPLLVPNQDWLRDRNTNWLLLMGRRRPGVTVAQARAEFTGLARQALAEGGSSASSPETRAAIVAAYAGGRGFSSMRGQLRGALVGLGVLAGLVLLIVAANVANLLLARAAGRRTEVGLRLALGAGRVGILRHLLAETVVLGTLAGALAVVVVGVGSAALRRQAERGADSVTLDLSLDPRVLGFAAALSVLTAVGLGLVPAVRGARLTDRELGAALRAHTRGMVGGPFGGVGRRFGLGQWLVVGQVALSLVLLAGAGLLVRSLRHLQAVDVGLAREALLLVPVDARPTGFAGDRWPALYQQLAARLRQVPGVREVSYSRNGLFTDNEMSATLQVPGFVARAAADTSADTDQVGPGYFRTIGARLLRGREVEARDDARAPRVAVINATMARFYFGTADPIGRSLRLDTVDVQIVGVVADVRGQSLRTAPTRRFYTPLAQGDGAAAIAFVLRTAGDPARAVIAARRALLAATPALRVGAARPVETLVRESLTSERVLARAAGLAGALALGLAALGLYGVLTYTVVQRTGEFGLRLALGARPLDVTRLVLGETLRLVLLGAALGLPAALGAARLLRNQFAGVGLVDLPTLAAALALLGVSAALAGYLPARRAARVAPQTALGGR